MYLASKFCGLHKTFRSGLLVVLLLLLGAILVTGSPTWAAPVLAATNQTVPPFAEHLLLPLIHNPLQPLNLTGSPDRDYQPTWSPDGSKLVFARERTLSDDEFRSDLYVINADGSGLAQLTDEAPPPPSPESTVWHAYYPTWSPDGSKLAFLSDRTITENQSRIDLYVINADGSGLAQLTDEAPPPPSAESDDWSISDLAWSPDGSEIAFTYSTCAPCNARGVSYHRLYTAGVDGEHLRQVSICGNKPKWSPDGSKILFQHPCWDDLTPSGALGVLDAVSGNIVLFSQGGTDAMWSPDGTKFAFVCLTCRSGYGYEQVVVANADSHIFTILSTENVFSAMLTWSPDSKQIAYAACREGRSELQVVDANGEDPTTLSDMQSLSALAWLPDGQRLVFLGQDYTSQHTSAYMVGRDGHDLRWLFALPSNVNVFNFIWSLDRTKLVFEYNGDIYILKVFEQ